MQDHAQKFHDYKGMEESWCLIHMLNDCSEWSLVPPWILGNKEATPKIKNERSIPKLRCVFLKKQIHPQSRILQLPIFRGIHHYHILSRVSRSLFKINWTYQNKLLVHCFRLSHVMQFSGHGRHLSRSGHLLFPNISVIRCLLSMCTMELWVASYIPLLYQCVWWFWGGGAGAQDLQTQQIPGFQHLWSLVFWLTSSSGEVWWETSTITNLWAVFSIHTQFMFTWSCLRLVLYSGKEKLSGRNHQQ